MKLVKTSYKNEDAIILLKDVTDNMKEMSTEEREKAIQSGVHYSEMLPEEKEPTKEYEALYIKALENHAKNVAVDVGKLAEIIYANTIKLNAKKPVLISLARAGIPVGVLVKRYLKQFYGLDCKHYAISIIRDRGIDINAMEYIYNENILTDESVVRNFIFIDGWTGKGAIKNQLDEAVAELKGIDNKWKDLRSDLYVIADPANITEYCGTHDDYLLPSSCLNSTVSGLISRTILNKYIDIESGDFHGAYYFKKFENIDYTNDFIDKVTNEFEIVEPSIIDISGEKGIDIVKRIGECFGVDDYKKIKPGIGETTRVLLRRVPWKVLLNINVSEKDADIQHILELCKEKNVPIEKFNTNNYKVVGIIKDLSADA